MSHPQDMEKDGRYVNSEPRNNLAVWEFTKLMENFSVRINERDLGYFDK